jgi:hypothetical protein
MSATGHATNSIHPAPAGGASGGGPGQGGQGAGGRSHWFGAEFCPGREPPFLAVKRPARPYKSAIQNLFTMRNAEGA